MTTPWEIAKARYSARDALVSPAPDPVRVSRDARDGTAHDRRARGRDAAPARWAGHHRRARHDAPTRLARLLAESGRSGVPRPIFLVGRQGRADWRARVSRTAIADHRRTGELCVRERACAAVSRQPAQG